MQINGKDKITIDRDNHGIPHIIAKSEIDLYKGLGFCHAMDRGLQILLMRILVRGKASEFLESSDELLKIDIFFRKMNFTENLEQQKKLLTKEAIDMCKAYCEGVNEYFSKKIPWELKLLKYKPELWDIEDIFLIIKLMSYVSLSQSQFEMESLFIQMVKAGFERAKLDELFPNILNGLDEELVKKVKIEEPFVPNNIKWEKILPKFMASNNWVISGNKTVSGHPILANDPHLETNRLPNIWYEAVIKISDEKYMMGGTIPGIPIFASGRTHDIAWGLTYSFTDSVDSWIENCKDGKYLNHENKMLDFKIRKEIIKRKKKDPVELKFYENEHGILNGNPFEEGFYLCTKFTANFYGANTVNNIAKLWNAKTVSETMKYIGNIELTFNFVIADRLGNIGYQMAGLTPKRREGISGFIPLAGWEKNNDWLSFVKGEELPRCENPKTNYFITANNNLNKYGIEKPINICMADYRAKRIERILNEKDKISIQDIYKMQYDVYSIQAEMFMNILKPLLPDTKQGNILKNWDYNYDLESEGAFLFEVVYKALLTDIFSFQGFGTETINYLLKETGIFVDFYENFDRILLSKDSLWFRDEDRDKLYKSIIEKALKVEVKKWKDVQKLTFTNIFFNGKLPSFLGFDKKDIELRGGRSTIHQGQIYRSDGRVTSFTPSFRTITDLSTNEIHTNLAGGPSDRRFSKWYISDLNNWVNEKYKIISP